MTSRASLRLLGVFALTSVVLPLTVGSASAAPVTIPTITAPAAGSIVTLADLPVQATSTATLVRFVIDGRGDAFTTDATVAAGVADATINVAGIDGATTLEAFDCDAPDQCNGTGATEDLTIDLTPPVVTKPAGGTVVGTSFAVAATSAQPGIAFTVNGTVDGFDGTPPYTATLSLAGRPDGNYSVGALQCDPTGAVCEGPASQPVVVVKDTHGPAWSSVAALPRLFYPYRDHYLDHTVLSARVGEPARKVHVVVRNGRGGVVRDFAVGSVRAGRVGVTWDGRSGKGQLVPQGRYTFRFNGVDNHGLASSSRVGRVMVSDKRLTARTATKTVTAGGSAWYKVVGKCSDVFKLGGSTPGPNLPHGVGYYSNLYCSSGAKASLAASVQRTQLARAVRYGRFHVDVYGGAADRHGGTAALLYMTPDRSTVHAGARLSTSLGWHTGRTKSLAPYVSGSGRLLWAVATERGAWYNVGSFRVTYQYFVLTAP